MARGDVAVVAGTTARGPPIVCLLAVADARDFSPLDYIVALYTRAVLLHRAAARVAGRVSGLSVDDGTVACGCIARVPRTRTSIRSSTANRFPGRERAARCSRPTPIGRFDRPRPSRRGRRRSRLGQSDASWRSRARVPRRPAHRFPRRAPRDLGLELEVSPELSKYPCSVGEPPRSIEIGAATASPGGKAAAAGLARSSESPLDVGRR